MTIATPISDQLLRRSQVLRPASLDRGARTVEAIASTGATVARRDARGPYVERLDLNSIDLAAVVGMPVLNAHRQASIRDAIGVTESARMEAGSLVVTIKIARGSEGDMALDLIEDRALRGVSIGYRATRSEQATEKGQRVVTIQPEIVEISLVPVPADPGAMIRSSGMEQETMTGENAHGQQDGAVIQARAETNRQIRSIASTAGLTREWADDQIDAGATIEAARASAFDAMRSRAPATIRSANAGHAEQAEDFVSRRGEALFARANPRHELSEPARQYAGDSLVDIARDVLRRSGQPITGLSAGEIATRALHSTSDFPLILGDAVGRTLRQAYSAAPSGLKRVGRQMNNRDFRPKHRIQLGEAPKLEKVSQNGEFTRGTMAEASETYSLDTFGRIIGISRKAIVNDDLGAFSDLTGRIGAAAAAFEAAQLVALFEANPEMSDGTAVFHADHGNLAAAGAALADTSLSAGRLAMRKQTGLSDDLIDVSPRFLLVPPALETTAEKLLSEVQATTTDDANPFSRLGLIVEPRFTSDTRWYLAADPATVDGLEFAYLEGEPGPQIEVKQGFDIDGIEVKVRLDFGAGFVDWRGFYRNDGA